MISTEERAMIDAALAQPGFVKVIPTGKSGLYTDQYIWDEKTMKLIVKPDHPSQNILALNRGNQKKRNVATDRRKHIAKLLYGDQLSDEDMATVMKLYNISKASVVCDVKIIKRSEEYETNKSRRPRLDGQQVIQFLGRD